MAAENTHEEAVVVKPQIRLWDRFPFSLLKNYWVRVIIIAIVGIYIGERLDETECWIRIRYEVFQRLQNLSPRKPHPQRTVLVLIDDDDYYKEPLQSRVPIKRDYLAGLVDAISAANAATIALDFDLRSPRPEGDPSEFPEYQGETNKLIQSITTASSMGKSIVLTKTIHDEGVGEYVIESDIYDPVPGAWQNVKTGYHVFSDDTRRFPPVLMTIKGQPVEPFSLSIARAENAASLKDIPNFADTLYAGFIPLGEFDKVSAREVLNGQKREKLANKVVLISGVWHQFGYQRGPIVNSYDTPVGTLPGVAIHANYFEALWDSRIYRVWEGKYMRITEFILALFVAFTLHNSLRGKTKKAMLVVPYLVILVGSYAALIMFGWFFDPFIPVLSVTAHGIFERVWEWRTIARNRNVNLDNPQLETGGAQV
jgi:CHASE2 domain-containing sensor protein